MLDRIVIIESPEGRFEKLFDSKAHKDSEALHYLLVSAQPGAEYTVFFKNAQ